MWIGVISVTVIFVLASIVGGIQGSSWAETQMASIVWLLAYLVIIAHAIREQLERK